MSRILCTLVIASVAAGCYACGSQSSPTVPGFHLFSLISMPTYYNGGREGVSASPIWILNGYTVEKVVGGSTASDGGFPYQASLRSWGSHFCGGSILNKRWILTAGHCVSGQNAKRVTVVVGTNLLSEGGDSYPVEKLLSHENYDPLAIRNDIGLVRVSDDIIFGPKIQAIPLPLDDFTAFDHTAVLSGWGRISYPGGLPDALQTIDLKVISEKTCTAAFSGSWGITKTNICTLTKKGEGACHGDSGGPLTADGEQIGIVSFGMPCALGYPDVYTRVWSFVDWIKEHIDEISDDSH